MGGGGETGRRGRCRGRGGAPGPLSGRRVPSPGSPRKPESGASPALPGAGGLGARCVLGTGPLKGGREAGVGAVSLGGSMG